MLRTIIIVLGLCFSLTASAAVTITVNETTDENNADGDCSLREAIEATDNNASKDACIHDGSAGTDTIILPAGTLTISGAAGDDGNGSGDYDIKQSVTITGQGASSTILDGGGLDRIFHIGVSGSTPTVTISNVTIQNGNSGPLDGGGIVVEGSGSLVVSNSIITGNITGPATGRSGGGIASQGSVTVNNSTISGNTADCDGGAIYAGSKPLNISNSTISGNSTDCRGGGIFIAATMNITNTTISGNTATDEGGGIFFNSGTSTLSNVTITNNTGDSDSTGDLGGGIDTIGTVNIKNSIIAGNTNPTGGPDCAGTFTSQGYNLVQDTTGCTIAGDTTGNITGSDPLLAALANNGGTTQTHALQNGSPAIDAGTPVASGDCQDNTGTALTQDQRAFTRPVNSRCDMGAVEFGTCGDGAADAGESCDDAGASATCDADCTAVSCGDGTVNTTAGEGCDDGNTTNGDGCSSTCVSETCGDGILESGTEECDDGNVADDDGCSSVCVIECGNGTINGAEECDDGNTTDGDGCSAICTNEVTSACGDGILQAGEECDDGNTTAGDGCSDTCTSETTTPTSVPGGGCSLNQSAMVHPAVTLLGLLLIALASLRYRIQEKSCD